MYRKNTKRKSIDIGIGGKSFHVPVLLREKKDENPKSVLFSRGRKSISFFTEDSKLYITPREQAMLRRGLAVDRKIRKWDSLSSRIVDDFAKHRPREESSLMKALDRRYEMMGEMLAETSRTFLGQFSLVRLWNMSIVGSILLGMMMMTFVYRYLGQGAAANQVDPVVTASQQAMQQNPAAGKVLGDETKKDDQEFAQQVMEIERINDKLSLEREIGAMVKGYPIEKMVPYIAQQDRTVAAFIVAIARKESGWGKHVPVLNGQDCYNYFGYRGQRKLMGTGGHTCFNSPQDAVNTVAKRIKTLVEEQGRDTPEKMVLWKCGSDCESTGGQAAADKWISDVDTIFRKINEQDIDN